MHRVLLFHNRLFINYQPLSISHEPFCLAGRTRMFPPTRPHRQALATALILAATVVPTGYVALTAWRIGRPGHLRDVEAALGRGLGLRVALEGIRYPGPGEVEYRGVVLRQEEP